MDLDLDLEYDKGDIDVMVECAHTILPPEVKLIRATGGVLALGTESGGSAGAHDGPVAVVCGGEFGPDNNHAPNELCTPLETSKGNGNQVDLSAGGFLNDKRVGSASLVIDNGTTLWVTGGLDELYPRSDSEFVSINSQGKNSNVFTTNGVGPELPADLMHHCLVKVTPQVAMLIGGRNSTFYGPYFL